MSDIIQLLPDSIASQIAAGEVIQRPASVVKELVENSIDANATNISIVLKDSGKTLIQVIDDGKGMSPTDARMCFERHATSKIKEANDIFKITTKGFRGEALASIAAIAHVELITKQKDDELGTKIVIIGSKFSKQEPVQSELGTKISVKNLFFNVPARRKFLKSDTVEFKHIIDEFFRLALAHIDISFSLFHNGKEMYRLNKSTLKQRVLNIFGRGYDNKLLSVEENMEIMSISGFAGKIDATRKTRSHQYIFVNNRFIKSNYLAHAIKAAYSEYIQEEQHPVYFLFLSVDPADIDVNIHPTKQEIKFEDERLIYNYIRVVFKRILGKFHYTPSLDFQNNQGLKIETLTGKKEYNRDYDVKKSNISPNMKKTNSDDWEKAFEILHTDTEKEINQIKKDSIEIPSKLNKDSFDFDGEKSVEDSGLYQLNNSYILREVEDGFLLIDQYYSHFRVLYEKYLNLLANGSVNIQQLMFPVSLAIDKSDGNILDSLLGEFKEIGFIIDKNENGEYLISGVPVFMENNNNITDVISVILEDYVDNKNISIDLKGKIAKIFARSNARNKGKTMTKEEMKYLVEKLFLCENPYKTPDGKKTFIKIDNNEIINRFRN